jgi:hypothetical protein
MWPAADVERIRAAVLDARTHGIRAEVDGVSAGSPSRKKKRVALFDAASRSGPGKSEIISPRPIQLRRPPLSMPEQSLPEPEPELLLDLVIGSSFLHSRETGLWLVARAWLCL